MVHDVIINIDDDDDRAEKLEVLLLRKILKTLERIEQDLNRPVMITVPQQVRVEVA